MDERRQDAARFVEMLFASREMRERDFMWPGDHPGSREYPHPLYGLYRADIELNTDRFLRQVRLVQEHDAFFPCISIRNLASPIPVDLFSIVEFTDVFDRRDVTASIEYVLQRIRILLERADLTFKPMRPADAVNLFKNLLEEFVYVRMIAEERHGTLFSRLFRRRRPTKASADFLNFEVFSKTKDLTVRYSPAYFVNPNLVFGAPTSPTSPVVAPIMPGRYIFGLADRDFPDFFPQEYDVPPQRKAYLPR